MIFGLCKNIISLLTGITLIKFIIKTAWIMLLAAISCFLMMKYFLPSVITDFSKKTATQIEKRFNNQIDSIKDKSSSKKIIKKFKDLKDKVSG